MSSRPFAQYIDLIQEQRADDVLYTTTDRLRPDEQRPDGRRIEYDSHEKKPYYQTLSATERYNRFFDAFLTELLKYPSSVQFSFFISQNNVLHTIPFGTDIIKPVTVTDDNKIDLDRIVFEFANNQIVQKQLKGAIMVEDLAKYPQTWFTAIDKKNSAYIKRLTADTAHMSFIDVLQLSWCFSLSIGNNSDLLRILKYIIVQSKCLDDFKLFYTVPNFNRVLAFFQCMIVLLHPKCQRWMQDNKEIIEYKTATVNDNITDATHENTESYYALMTLFPSLMIAPTRLSRFLRPYKFSDFQPFLFGEVWLLYYLSLVTI